MHGDVLGAYGWGDAGGAISQRCTHPARKVCATGWSVARAAVVACRAHPQFTHFTQFPLARQTPEASRKATVMRIRRADPPDQPRVDDHFEDELLDPRWVQGAPGGGRLEIAQSALRMAFESAEMGRYSDAQIDDHMGLHPARFPWRPPLRMEARARASHPAFPATRDLALPPAAREDPGAVDRFRLTPFDARTTNPSISAAGVATQSPEQVAARRKAAALSAPTAGQEYLLGTVGFGFWNASISLMRSDPRWPDAIWFFGASPPSDMALVPGVAGWGWKAQVVHANRIGALLAGAPTLGAMLWARLSGRAAAYDGAGRWLQTMTGAQEAPLDGIADLRVWHEYTLEWRREEVRFWVDGVETLGVPQPPQGPLGFVAWIDNQYAVATPRGELRFGTLTTGPQWLEMDYLRIIPL